VIFEFNYRRVWDFLKSGCGYWDVGVSFVPRGLFFFREYSLLLFRTIEEKKGAMQNRMCDRSAFI